MRHYTSRILALELDISRWVVVTAYNELFGRGVLERRRGAGTFVHKSDCPAHRPGPRNTGAEPASTDMPISKSNMEHFPVVAWRSAWHQAAYRAPGRTDVPTTGLPELRQHIATYLTKVRGVWCDPREVLITRGIIHGLDLFANAILSSSATIVVDSMVPPLRWHPRFLTVCRADLTNQSSPVRIAHRNVDALIVAPGGLGPGVGVIPVSRRWAVLGSASAQGAYVLELDTGTELLGEHYMPPLKTMAPAEVIHVGDLAHLFSDEVRLAYLVLPRGLQHLIQQRMTDEDMADCVAQRAISRLLASGEGMRYANLLTRTLERKRAQARRWFDKASVDTSALLFSGAYLLVRVGEDIDVTNLGALLRNRGIAWSESVGVVTIAGTGRTAVLNIGQLDDERLFRALPAVSDILPRLCRT